MVYDEARGRSLLFGGYLNAAYLDDTWEWAGGNNGWTQLTPTTSPQARWAHTMAYDRNRQTTVMFGGLVLTQLPAVRDTWELRSTSPARFSTYGVGCPGSLGPPSLSLFSSSLPWTGEGFTVRLDNLPVGSLPFLVLGFSQLSQPLPMLPGCTQLLSADTVVSMPPIGNFTILGATLPADPTLAGWQFFMQGAVLNAGGNNSLGVALSNGGAVTIGVR